MSSSDCYSSGNEGKPKVSDDSDASAKKHRKRPTRNTSSKAIIESAGSSDSENSDSDCRSDNDGSRAGARRKRKGSSSLNRKGNSYYAKRKRAVSEESDRGEMDDDLFADEEDRRQVMAMNEKDREQEIFNRMEQQEMRRTRKQIEEKLAAAKNASSASNDKKEKKERRRREERKRINESDSDDGKYLSSRAHSSGTKSKAVAGSGSESEADMTFHRPSEVYKKATQKNAMADLLAKRKDKENKAAKKAALSIDAVREGGSEDDDAKKEARREVETVAELSRARISRYKMAKIVYAPFFAKTVVGCFVRVGLGGYGGKSKYRLSQVVDVVETNRVYTFENNKTNKGLKLRYGSDERVFRIEFVSNAEFSEEEFLEWRKVTKEECGSLPTMDHIEKKETDIRKAMNFNYTDEVIEYIVQEKKKFSDKVKNFAVTKGELIKQKFILCYFKIVFINFLLSLFLKMWYTQTDLG
ncbi:Plus-3 domain protein [Dictyocaulus viviparus]|uniref:Plus-3 domain protein n=1 Tax=Dictyocaulus viviparus TaxID=29172 RepID=A0A0D8XZR2_DICVI|nr:Plus-3 domain protein [Dictyocaulus viviparus]